ncbi:MAG: hypothetical protein AB1295_01170 [Candidatus Micrarchaeota archaeon]
MVSKGRAVANTIALTLPLASALLYCALAGAPIPQSIMIPLAGGGLMNLGFWLFYHQSIGPIPELSGSMFGRKGNFLLVGLLHFAVLPLALVIDLSWLQGII